jgi:hypothetical protein
VDAKFGASNVPIEGGRDDLARSLHTPEDAEQFEYSGG